MTQTMITPLDYADAMPVKPFRYGVMEAKRRIQQAQSGQFFFSTGIETLDKFVRLRPATYTIIAGEPGTGKTALALHLAGHFVQTLATWGDKRKVLIFSAEMASAELAQRIASSRTGISIWEQESGKLTPAQVNQLFFTFDDIAKDTPFQIDEADSPDQNHIFNSCHIVNEATGLAAVILDYVELAVTDERQKAEHVRAVSKMLKTVSKVFKVPAIGLSQRNKDHKSRASKRPEMTDLRYGGHEPADAVVILDNAEDVSIESSSFMPMRAWVVKNRAGRKGAAADILFNGATMEFFPGDFRADSLNGDY